MRDLRLGDEGEAVVDVRSRLATLGLADAGAERAALFDTALDTAVRLFQERRGLTVDGIVGAATYRALEDATWSLGDRVLVHVPGAVLQGDDVIALQQQLLHLGFAVGQVDGRFGQATERAVTEFQRNAGLVPDGTCGPATLKALGRLAPRASGGDPNAIRGEERLRAAGPQLAGKVVVIDADGSDGATDVAARVEGRLAATGVQAFLTRQRTAAPRTQAEVADFAHRAEASLVVAIHATGEPDATGIEGIATYYYGIAAHQISSPVGERFAGLVRREIVARTGLPDSGSHARAWDLLRRTRMPAVVVETGNGLTDPALRDQVAGAIVAAVQRLYLTDEDDTNTGVLELGELRRSLGG